MRAVGHGLVVFEVLLVQVPAFREILLSVCLGESLAEKRRDEPEMR